MLRRQLQQLSSIVNIVSFSFLISLLLAHILLRRFLPHVAHGKENFDFFFEGDQEGDDQHHPPFVVDWRVLVGTVLAFLVSCAVDVGGLAGGGLLVPIFYQVVGVGLKASTGLSQAAIAGASAAALAANLFRAQIPLHSHTSRSYKSSESCTPPSTGGHHHASTNPWLQDSSMHQHAVHGQHRRQHQHAVQQPPPEQQQQQLPLVDLDLVLLLTPGLLLGVAVGAVLNDLLPEWFICAALVGVLFLSCHKTAVRGLLTWHAESQAEASLAAAAAISSGPKPLLRPIHTGSQRSLHGGTSSPGSLPGSKRTGSERRQRSGSGSSSPAGILGDSGIRRSSSATAQLLKAADLDVYSSPPHDSIDTRLSAPAPAGDGAGSKGQQAAANQLEEASGSWGSPVVGSVGGSNGSTPQPGTPQPPSSGATLQAGLVCTPPTRAVAVSTAAAADREALMQQQQQQYEASTSCQGHIAAAGGDGAADHLVQPAAVTMAPDEVAGLSLPPAAAADDSDSSSSASYAELLKQRSLPIYQCEVTPLPPTGQHSAAATAAIAAGGTGAIAAAAAAAAAAVRPRGLARKGLYPSWFSPPDSDPGEALCAAAAAGPSVEWRPCSRSSSVGTGMGYVIADNRLPVWRQQQQLSQVQSHRRDSRTAAAAAAAAAVQLHLQQLWLWLPHVHLQQVPWMKLLSLGALWLGFMGLTALSGLLPLCSWSYVSYLLLFMGITGCVAATLIQVLLVEPLMGAQQVSRLSRKLQQLLLHHGQSTHTQHSCWEDVEAQQQQQQQQQQPDALQQPLLQEDYGQYHHPQQQQQQQQQGEQLWQQGHADAAPQQQQHQQAVADMGSGLDRTGEGSRASAASGAAAWAALRRAAGSTHAWLHVLTGFGRAGTFAAGQQQQHVDSAAAAANAAAVVPLGGLVAQGAVSAQQQQQQKLSLFAQMRLRQQQQQLRQAALPPMGPVEAATDSYFFPVAAAAAAADGSHGAAGSSILAAGQPCQPLVSAAGRVGYGSGQQLPAVAPPQRVLCPPAAPGTVACRNGSRDHRGGFAGLWAGFSRMVGFRKQGSAPQPLDPFDGNEQPWRNEEPFPVAAAAAAAVSPGGPAPTLAAAAAAAAAGGSSALVTIAAAAAVVSVAAGVLTAVTGVAGSALILPILLDFRVHTQVAMASTVVLVFLSSTAATLSFILQGRLIGTYAVLFCVVGLCGGCLGVSVVGALLRLAKRPSVVVLLLSGALAVAGLSCSVAGVYGFAEAWEQGRLGVRALCQQ